LHYSRSATIITKLRPETIILIVALLSSRMTRYTRTVEGASPSRRAISRVGILAENFNRMISRACRIATLSAGIDLSLIGKGETLKQASRRARSHSKPRAG
jgi:hypothetical protein